MSTGNTHDTLRWKDDALELIDQRLLPGEVLYRRYQTAESVADAITQMVVRGAPAIGCAAAYGVAAEAVRLRGEEPAAFAAGLENALKILAASRPTRDPDPLVQ